MLIFTRWDEFAGDSEPVAINPQAIAAVEVLTATTCRVHLAPNGLAFDLAHPISHVLKQIAEAFDLDPEP